MKDRFFLDTNVLVYAYDRHEQRKQQIAQGILIGGLEQENAALSGQVLGEFFNVVTRMIKEPMTSEEAQSAVQLFGHLQVQEIDFALVKRAIETHKVYRLSYWDALIIAAAERTDCRQILTEDLNDGQYYHGIYITNPFKQENSSKP